MPGNNLAIRMFAGYIFTDCLVHFDEEIMHLVINWYFRFINILIIILMK